MCQCPRRALLISTQILTLGMTSKSCVNALGGLFSFLRPDKATQQGMRRHVSMPSAGSSHFYTRPSLLSNVERVCQCPRRALLISTVPPGNPHKYWLSSLIFAGICLNILKSSVFSPFLVLFTICSYLDAFYTSSDTVNIILYLPI